MPGRTLIFMNLYVYGMCLFVHYVPDIEPGLSATDALLALCVMAAAFFYVGVAIIYLIFHFKYAKVPRSYKSPFGQFGAWASLIISLLLLIAKIGLSHIFQITFAIFVVKLAIFSVFYIFHGRLHLLPTEDAVISVMFQEQRKGQLKEERLQSERRRSILEGEILKKSLNA